MASYFVRCHLASVSSDGDFQPPAFVGVVSSVHIYFAITMYAAYAALGGDTDGVCIGLPDGLHLFYSRHSYLGLRADIMASTDYAQSYGTRFRAISKCYRTGNDRRTALCAPHGDTHPVASSVGIRIGHMELAPMVLGVATSRIQ